MGCVVLRERMVPGLDCIDAVVARGQEETDKRKACDSEIKQKKPKSKTVNHTLRTAGARTAVSLRVISRWRDRYCPLHLHNRDTPKSNHTNTESIIALQHALAKWLVCVASTEREGSPASSRTYNTWATSLVNAHTALAAH
eukprot:3889822-Rhodomonas_salina.2